MGFSGLSNVMQGLFASQEALRITGENVQNASTPGYARRVATFSATSPTGNIGVSVSGEVMRDDYLDSKVWTEESISTEWETKANYYDRIMGIIDEPTDYSISEVTSDFFTAFQTLANEPSNISYRIAAIDAAEQFTNLLNNTASQLENVQAEINEDVMTYVTVVNSLIDEIAELNQTIYQTEIVGRDASYSRDALQRKISELSQYGNVTVKEVSRGKLSNGAEDMRLTVSFGGMVVINHTSTTKLTCVKRETKKNVEDIEGLYDIELETGSKLDLASGKLKALIELRDGTGENTTAWVKGIVYYMRDLNKFARTFAKVFNEGIIDYDGKDPIDPDTEVPYKGYANAYTFGSQPLTNAAGEYVDENGVVLPPDAKPVYQSEEYRFFTINNMTREEFTNKQTLEEIKALTLDEKNALYNNLTAKNISISADILNNIENMASSFENAEYENDVQSILDLVAFREDANIFSSGDVDGFIEGMIASIGLDANKSISLSELHSTLLEQSKNNQASHSDVSLNEETTFAVQFQQMYKACANLVNIYSELYDSLLSAI